MRIILSSLGEREGALGYTMEQNEDGTYRYEYEPLKANTTTGNRRNGGGTVVLRAPFPWFRR
jgi:hypothetical protein